MNGPYSAKAIANEFLTIAKDGGVKDMTPIKVQKLVYFAHGWNLAFFKKPLIRQGIQAWKFGPVVADVYHEFKECGNEPIDRLATEFAYDDDLGLIEIEPRILPGDSQTRGVLDEVFRIYGRFTPIQLSNLTHEPNTPWAMVAKKFGGELPKNELIPDPLIQEYFDRKLHGSAA